MSSSSSSSSIIGGKTNLQIQKPHSLRNSHPQTTSTRQQIHHCNCNYRCNCNYSCNYSCNYRYNYGNVKTRDSSLTPLLPPETVSHVATIVGNGVGLNNNLVWVLHGGLGPHANRPATSGSLDDGVVGLGGSLAVQIKDLTDRVGALQDLNLGLAGSLSGVLGPPHDLDALDRVRDWEGLDGSESSLLNGSLHGVLGVRLPDIVLEGNELLGAFHGRNLGSKGAGELLGSSGGDLEGLGSLGEGEHSLVRGLGAVLEVDVHGVEQTDRSFPEFDLGLQGTSIGLQNVLQTLRVGGNVPGSDGATSLDALHGNVGGEQLEGTTSGSSEGRRTRGRPTLASDIEGGVGRSGLAVGSKGRGRGHEDGSNGGSELHLADCGWLDD
mmetsp:Transcript_13509/g.31600  ORF Transcript_13509/g.31600 Transcript_13509/m.31600 type:complete len:381 (+) Transcript_13509:822-1964(+)